MYKREFDKAKKDFKAYLFWGEEPYYIERYTQNIANTLSQKEERVALYFDEYNYDEAKNFLSQSSLFADKKVLIIKHEKALSKKELKSLIEICNKNPDSYLLYALYSNEGKKIASLFEAQQRAVQVRFFKPNFSEAKNELLLIAKEKSIPIDSFAIDHLLSLLENNLSLAAKELEKLSLLDEISIKDIDRVVYPLTSLNLERLYISIIKKEPLNKLLKKAIEEEQNEMKILLGFENFLQQLFLFYSYIRLFGAIDSAKILGYKLPKHIEEERTRLAISIKNYPQIFLLLQECEHLLKTKSNINKEATLFSYLIKIQALF